MCKEKHERSIAGEKVFSARGACLYPFHPDSKNYEICLPLTKIATKLAKHVLQACLAYA